MPPISPALRCVVSLSALFFSVYFVAVFARLSWLLAGLFVAKPAAPEHLESVVEQATDALTPVPMLCVLMISLRLRALQLELPNGDPPHWIQSWMYAHTGALFVRVFLDVFVGLGTSLLHQIARLAYASATVVLYWGAAVVVAGIVTATAVAVDEPTPKPSAMMKCTTVMAVSYILECVALEVLRSPGAVRVVDLAADTTFLQFPLMLCVLLLSMSLRAVQLHLQPAAWALTAIYMTTGAVVARAIWGVLGSLPCAGRLSGFPAICLATAWTFLSGVVYVGTAVIMVGAFVMEAVPLLREEPPVEVLAHQVRPVPSQFADLVPPPPLPVSMKCVAGLTLLYFSIHLCLTTGNVLAGKSAVRMLDGAQRALAFAPMLCITMMALRLRAMQLQRADPQPWAQNSMCVATVATVVQVLCSMRGAVAEQDSLTGKLVAIVRLVLRHLAGAVLFLSMAALVLALLLMEPVFV